LQDDGMSEETGAAAPLQAPWRIGVDVGGTFTDLVLQDATGRIAIAKVPSVPADPSRGVITAVEHLAAAQRTSAEAVLAGCAVFVHGSTIATNTILEGKGARVGLLTSHGFRDSLEIRRGLRENMWDHRAPFPPPLVPRYLRQPVRGRIDPDGREHQPLEPADVQAALAVFRDEGVDAIAICFINSFANAEHEKAVASLVRDAGNAWWVTASSEVMPIIGEYERSSTTVVNAYVGPRVVPYLGALDDELRRRGLPHGLVLVQSNGGVASVGRVADKPVNLALSGPAAGVGALRLFAQTAGTDNLISMEIGGTSCDVMLMAEGRVATTDHLMVGGYHLSTPAIEIHTVGAGGGTIAGVDGAGLLFVGPKGAGANPGPACYGLGNMEPTVTDALLVLGRLRPGAYAGGAVTLDAKLARDAVERAVAKPLGLPVEEAAAGIIRLLEQNLLHAVERISIERGVDPRRFALVAAGGAGPMHGVAVARALGCPTVYVPRIAGAFCALGMLRSDARQDWIRVFTDELDTAQPASITEVFDSMETEARRVMQGEGFPPAKQQMVRTLDLRYPGQQSSLPIELVNGFDAGAVRADFEARHQMLFGHIQPQGRIAIGALRLAGIGRMEDVASPPAAHIAAAPQPIERRRMYIDAAAGWQEVPVYDGADLGPGHAVVGPVLVNEATTTVFAGPGDRLSVDASGNFRIELAGARASLPAHGGVR
jgi:N-methylhydantoinase A